MESATPLRLQTGLLTRRGVARERNEDACFIDPDKQFFIVADGMGSQRGGGVASRLAVRLLSQSLRPLCRGAAAAPKVVDALHRIFSEVNELIITARGEDPRLQHMGTTAAVALVQNWMLHVASVGDNRVYHIRDGAARQLTVDQTVAQALVEAGILPARESKFHPYRNVLHKYLGCAEFGDGPCVSSVDLQQGDSILLATDGLTDKVDDGELARIVGQSQNAQSAAEALARTAVEHGSSDDITGVAVFVGPGASRKGGKENDDSRFSVSSGDA